MLALEETMIQVDRISTIITDNIMGMGNLNKQEVALVNDIKKLKEEYQELVNNYNSAEYEMFEFIRTHPDKLKKHDQLYKKIHDMREKRLEIIEKIKDKEATIVSIQIPKQGSGEVQEILDGKYEKMKKKLESARKNFPDLYNEVRRKIASKVDDHLPSA